MTSVNFQSEIVLAFVGPVGVDEKEFLGCAESRLKAFGYNTEVIKLSTFIKSIGEDIGLKTDLHDGHGEFDRILSYMRGGDELRERASQAAALGTERDAHGLLAHAAAAIIGDRRGAGDPTPMPGHAWLISSLKNPAEVDVLRSIYRTGFYLIGLFATEAERINALVDRGMTSDEARKLISEDTEGSKKFGQQTRKTFELADAWVKTKQDLLRVIDLLFGNTFWTPTDEENAMALAYTEALRSSDLSRQVGAVLVSPGGEVIATGRNEAPAPGGGQYSPPSHGRPSARDSDIGEDYNHRERLDIQKKLRGDIAERAEKCFNSQQVKEFGEIVDDVLAKSALKDITEYGRAVHAEMSAILSAGRTGVSVRDSTLFCTTFPCHNCAKHIVASGIRRVFYVEPYPKSKAKGLHADSLSLEDEDLNVPELTRKTDEIKERRTVFSPFLGVGPRRYFDVFSLRLGAGRTIERKDGQTGRKVDFVVHGATPRVQLAPTNYLQREIEAANSLLEAIEALSSEETQ